MSRKKQRNGVSSAPEGAASTPKENKENKVNIVKLDVEYTGSRDVLVNGVNVFAGSKAKAAFEAQIFKKQLTDDQQWQISCEICRLAAQVRAAFFDNQVACGKMTEEQRKMVTLTL